MGAPGIESGRAVIYRERLETTFCPISREIPVPERRRPIDTNRLVTTLHLDRRWTSWTRRSRTLSMSQTTPRSGPHRSAGLRRRKYPRARCVGKAVVLALSREQEHTRSWSPKGERLRGSERTRTRDLRRDRPVMTLPGWPGLGGDSRQEQGFAPSSLRGLPGAVGGFREPRAGSPRDEWLPMWSNRSGLCGACPGQRGSTG
jgi:hypothetical protein